MKIISNHKSITENLKTLGDHINRFVDLLKRDPLKNQQKIVEVCHAGKFLMILGEGTIECLAERPDFIININGIQVGLEHQVVINANHKETEGFLRTFFQ